jgi:hypothetical protein
MNAQVTAAIPTVIPMITAAAAMTINKDGIPLSSMVPLLNAKD